MSVHGVTAGIWAATALGPRPASGPVGLLLAVARCWFTAPIVTFPRISDVKATNGVSHVPCRPKSRSGPADMPPSAALSPQRRQAKEFIMSREQENKAIVGRWFKEFWGNPWTPSIVDALAAPDMLLQYSLHAPRRGREDVKAFMTGFRGAFPDLSFAGAADLIAEGDYVVGRWQGGGTHTGPAFSDFLIGSLPAASGRKMRFTGTTVLRVENGKIAEEIGLDDGLTALQQLGIIRAV
jgi:predicted ester cyclase